MVLTPGQENRGARPNLLPRKTDRRLVMTLHLAFGGTTSSTPISFEALQRTGKPLSAKELDRKSSVVDFNLGELSYHLRSLEKIGLLERAQHERVTRGSHEVFYFLDPDLPR